MMSIIIKKTIRKRLHDEHDKVVVDDNDGSNRTTKTKKYPYQRVN